MKLPTQKLSKEEILIRSIEHHKEYVEKYIDKNGLREAHEEAYKLCKTYPSWFFYYGEMKTIRSITL